MSMLDNILSKLSQCGGILCVVIVLCIFMTPLSILWVAGGYCIIVRTCLKKGKSNQTTKEVKKDVH